MKVWGGEKIFRSGEGKGIRGWGGGGGRGKKWGKKTEGEKRKRKKRGKEKENHAELNRRHAYCIDRETSAQEPNALPVAYWDSPASL